MVTVGTTPVEYDLRGDDPVIPLTRMISPPTKWVPRYVPNTHPTQQQMPAVAGQNKRTLIGIPAQG